MRADALVLDILISWIGAAGCARYLYFLRRSGERRSLAAIRFLVVVIALVLALRGIAWWLDNVWLYRLVIAVAALLPLSITLFVEHLLRRHSPVWLKLLALVTSTSFLACDAAGLIEQAQVHSGFMTALGAVLVANGMLLLDQREAQLTANEQRLARTLVIVAVLSLPLIVSDYRLLPRLAPLRLDGIAALVFVYVMVSAAAHDLAPWMLARRLLGWLCGAAVLAAVFALVAAGTDAFAERFLVGTPVAYAWLLLSAIFARCSAVSADADANGFERWLNTAPLHSLAAFVQSLSGYAQTQGYVALGASDLTAYDVPLLFAADESGEPVSLAWARRHGSTGAAEQWRDLLERHEMTLALPICARRPLIVLLNQPIAGSGSIAHLRAALVLRLARHLAAVEA
jgi:hypothetical protein